MYVNVKYTRKSIYLHRYKASILLNNLFGRNLNPTTFQIHMVILGSVLIVVVVILLLTNCELNDHLAHLIMIISTLFRRFRRILTVLMGLNDPTV